MSVKFGLVPLDYSSQEQSQQTMYAKRSEASGVDFLFSICYLPDPLLFVSLLPGDEGARPRSCSTGCHAHQLRLDGQLYITSRTNEWRHIQKREVVTSEFEAKEKSHHADA